MTSINIGIYFSLTDNNYLLKYILEKYGISNIVNCGICPDDMFLMKHKAHVKYDVSKNNKINAIKIAIENKN
jgi:hypothetical protein